MGGATTCCPGPSHMGVFTCVGRTFCPLVMTGGGPPVYGGVGGGGGSRVGCLLVMAAGGWQGRSTVWAGRYVGGGGGGHIGLYRT